MNGWWWKDGSTWAAVNFNETWSDKEKVWSTKAMFKLNLSVFNWNRVSPSDGVWRATGVGLTRQSVKDGGVSGLGEQVDTEEGDEVGEEEEVK